MKAAVYPGALDKGRFFGSGSRARSRGDWRLTQDDGLDAVVWNDRMRSP